MKAVLLAVSQTPIPPPTVDGSQATVADARIDPFSATESEIKSLRPDITVRFHEKTHSLRVIVDVRDSRRRSKLLKLIEATPGALFLRSERAYYVLTQSLGDLLRQLRTAKATFAVERTLGDQLKATAARRAALIAQPTTASAADIQECLLFPSVVRRTEEEHGEWYRLEGYTATHLKIAFPDLESYGQRRERAESLTIAEVADVRYRLQSVGVTLWLPSSMEERLAENASRLRRKLEDGKLILEESTLDALSPDAAWVVAPDGRAGIVVDPQSLIDFYQRAIQQKKRGCLVPAFGKRVFHPAVDSELPSTVEYVERQLERTIPRSKAFAERLTECHRRSVLRGRCMELQQQVDAKLAAPRTELEESLRRLFPHLRVAVEFLL
ncbi:MAG: hypothetical protein IT290_12335 [Deltaproteobacteria bacterium]|nr:hypothetical protein [Deltaproteobacteria bacterium]